MKSQEGLKEGGESETNLSGNSRLSLVSAGAGSGEGLNDCGSPPIEPALSALVYSLENEAGLHRHGRFLMRAHLRDLLNTRRQLAAFWHPRLEPLDSIPFCPPVFIMGMPRSGSTFLHELMASDTANRAPRVWEVMFPMQARADAKGRTASLLKTGFCLWLFRRLARGADQVYPMRARTPHECVAIHSYTFMSQEFISSCRLPSYEVFLRGADLLPVYQWEKRFLQHLQMGRSVTRWLLKSPDHVYGLDAIFSVFPDACVIQTHRNPLDALTSSIQLTKVLQGLYATPVDEARIAEREALLLAGAMQRAMDFRDAHPEMAARFIDVKYSELVADPLRQVRRIYQQFHMRLSETAEAQMRALAGCRTRYHKRRVTGGLAAQARSLLGHAHHFRDYCQRFGIATPRLG